MAAEEPVAVDIHDLTHDGRGVGDLAGRRVFVAGALPSERVLLKPRRRRRQYQQAELLDVLAASGDRVKAPCPYFGRCGGCALQHMNYPAQIAFKQNVAVQAFRRIAGFEPDRWLEPVTGAQWNYRRKARLGVKYVERKQRVLVGFRERAAPYITDMDACPVLAPPMDTAIGELAEVIVSTGVKARLPQAELAIGDTGAALVLRVLDAPAAADVAAFRAFGERRGIDIYLQRGGPGTVEAVSDEAKALSYALPEFGLKLDFLPTDFIQVNAEVNARMVSAAVEMAAPTADDKVLDLYCGLGNFSLALARSAGSLLGVEADAGLVARAARNAAANGIANARFVAADLAQADWSFLSERWDLVMLDPPRSGAEAIMPRIGAMAPSRVVYVSCHPATLARDAKVLVREQAYRLVSARVFDMFPQTHHVELMAYFERQSP